MTIKAFLEEYADSLREEFDWSEIAPCAPIVQMAPGQVLIVDRNNDTIAMFFTDVPREQYNPSCPISQRDIQGAKLLIEVINYLGAPPPCE